MAYTNINIHTDSDVNDRVKHIFSEIGIDTDAAVNIFFRQVIRANGLPFKIKAPSLNKKTSEALAEVEAMKKDPFLGKSYTDVDEMMKELLS